MKVKVGGTDLETDVARVMAVHRGAPRARISLDANASLSASEAVSLVAKTVVVAVDESVITAADAWRATRLGAPHIINVNLMKAGIAEALDIAAVARAAGMSLMIGGNVESILSMTVSACFAAGLGDFEHVDLDTPLFFAETPFEYGFTLRGSELTVPLSSPGHGLRPKAIHEASAKERSVKL